jgi:integrase
MRVELKHVHTVRKVLADGSVATYHYAWRGGPRLKGEPGTAEFLRSYEAARGEQRTPDASQLRSIIAKFKASTEFTHNIRERTRRDYVWHLSKIEQKFGTLPLEALNDPRVTHEFRKWHASMANSPRQADYTWDVLMRLLSWARGEGLTTYRPPQRVTRLYRSDRAEKIWTEADIVAFAAVAPSTLQIALILALETGQRQGDLLVLPWSGYDGKAIRLKQSKGLRRVSVPVTGRLREVLDTAPRVSTMILTNSAGRPWTPHSFQDAFRLAKHKAGISHLHFHDLRGTAVTRLSEAGCTPQEIATITGHSLREIGAILDKYTARTAALATNAIEKLERSRA